MAELTRVDILDHSTGKVKTEYVDFNSFTAKLLKELQDKAASK